MEGIGSDETLGEMSPTQSAKTLIIEAGMFASSQNYSMVLPFMKPAFLLKQHMFPLSYQTP